MNKNKPEREILKPNFHMGTVEKVGGKTTTLNKKSGKIQENFHQGEVEKIDTKVFLENLKNPGKMKDSKREKDDVVAFLRRQNRQSPTYQIHLGTKYSITLNLLFLQ